MNGIPWKSTLIILALVAALLLSLEAEGQERRPTQLGLWAQAMGRTTTAQFIGCDIQPPYSTHCWQDVIDGNGRILYQVHYRQNGNHIQRWIIRER